MKKQGTPTGSLREARWLKMRLDEEDINGKVKPESDRIVWMDCEHLCNTSETVIHKQNKTGKEYKVQEIHGKWIHPVSPVTGCHLPLLHKCPGCVEFPTGYPVMLRFKKEK